MVTNRILRTHGVAVFALLLLVSLAVTYFIVRNGLASGLMILILTMGIVLVVCVARDYRLGFYFVFLMGVFMFYVDRVVDISFPMGTIYDGIIALAFISLFFQKQNNWTAFKNPVTIMFAILIVYQILQLLNPSATSTFAWLVSLRNNTSFLLYVVAFQMFSSVKSVKTFTLVWMTTAVIVAIYGIWQKVFGLSDIEMAWMNAHPERLKLYINWGQLRVFSFLSDPSSYGLFIGISALAAMAMAFGPFKPLTRLVWGFVMILLMVSMSYSGTRTALALVAIGVVFYTVIVLHNWRTLIAAAAMVFIGLVLLFGPFYGGTMTRLRSTFRASDDPSMAVRDYKRTRFQDYIQSHPIGGGLNSVGNIGHRYSPGHELAGEWEPDSGYLLTALESGWIGLLIFQGFFFIVMLSGINNFFRMEDPLLKTYMLAYIVPFLALSVAHFTQDAMFTKPMNVIVFATYALVIKLPMLQKKLFAVKMV